MVQRLNAINSTSANQTESSADDDFIDGKDLSSAVRVFNGIMITLMFTIGLCANLLVLYLLRRGGILLKNTSVILANILITDLFCVLIVLPHDFTYFVLDLTLSQSNSVLKIFFAFKNVLIFLNCDFTIALTIERTKTTTYLGKRRGDRLSQSLKFCLAAIWFLGFGEGVITYQTVNESNILPCKFSIQAGRSSARSLSAGSIITMVIVLAASLVTLVSVYHIRSFLLRLNADSKQSFRGFPRRKRLHKRITVAWFASLATLIVSYVPAITAILIWYSLGKQNRNGKSVVQMLCSVSHTINPVMAIAISCRMQRVFVRVLRGVEPFKTILKKFPSLYSSRTSLSGENILLRNGTSSRKFSLRLPNMPLEKKFQNDQCNLKEEKANDDIVFCGEIVIHAVFENRGSGNESGDDHSTEVEKKLLTRKRSSSLGCRLTVPQENTNFDGKLNFFNRSDSKIYKPLEPCDYTSIQYIA